MHRSALKVLVGDLPLVWDDYDGLCWESDNMTESLDVNTTDLREYRDEVQAVRERAALFLNNRIEKNKKERKENHVG